MRLNARFVLLGILVQRVSKRRVLKVPFLPMGTTNVHRVPLGLSRNLEHPFVKNVQVGHFHWVGAERARLALKCHRVWVVTPQCVRMELLLHLVNPPVLQILLGHTLWVVFFAHVNLEHFQRKVLWYALLVQQVLLVIHMQHNAHHALQVNFQVRVLLSAKLVQVVIFLVQEQLYVLPVHLELTLLMVVCCVHLVSLASFRLPWARMLVQVAHLEPHRRLVPKNVWYVQRDTLVLVVCPKKCAQQERTHQSPGAQVAKNVQQECFAQGHFMEHIPVSRTITAQQVLRFQSLVDLRLQCQCQEQKVVRKRSRILFLNHSIQNIYT